MSQVKVKPNDALTSYLVQHLLGETPSKQYITGNIGKDHLDASIKSLRKISDRYTQHEVGSALDHSVCSQQEAIAYALYYLPINFAKIARLLPLCELPQSYSVLDYGSGPGTGALAALFHTLKPGKVVCVDHSQYMRTVAQTLLSPLQKVHSNLSQKVVGRMQDVPDSEKFDVVIAANVLAELSEIDGKEILTQLVQRLTPEGFLVLVEPGQPAHTRRLMGIRDLICSQHRELCPIFPCCRNDACPMLASSPNDWCHGTLSWDRPRLIYQLDDGLEFNKHRLKYSAFIFQKHGQIRSGYRVIQAGQRSKKVLEAGLCGRNFFGPVVLKPLSRTPENRALERSEVFDRLELTHPAARLLPADTQVKQVE